MAGKMKALQAWCQRHTSGYKDVSIDNMTTSWRDGLAFCALIHNFRPDLIDFDSLSKENIIYNNQLAFHTAQNDLGIAALLDAEDMVAMKVPDKLSIITYVSQYYNCLHKMEPAQNKAMKRVAPPEKPRMNTKRKPVPISVENKEVMNEVAVPNSEALAAKKQVFSTCEICKNKVHLVERYIDDNKVYHRQCHRMKSLSGMYRRNYRNSSTNQSVKEPPKSSEDCNNSMHSAATLSNEKLDVIDTVNGVNEHSGGNSENKKTNGTTESSQSPEALHKTVTSENSSDNDDQVNTNVEEVEACSEPLQSSDSTVQKVATTDNVETSAKKDCVNMNDPNVVSENHCTPTDEHASRSEDHESKDMLPSLLESLADGEHKRIMKLSESSATENDDFSPTSAIAPLISELPIAPEKKSGAGTTSGDTNERKPVPRARSTRPSQVPDDKRSSEILTDEYDNSLNPFAESDTNSDGGVSSIEEDFDKTVAVKKNTAAESYDDSLNPFGDESSDSQDNNETLVKTSEAHHDSLNPFLEDDDEDVQSSVAHNDLTTQSKKDAAEKSALSCTTKLGMQTNDNSNGDALNPFANDLEEKKTKLLAPSVPRKKGHAPPPPKIDPPMPKEMATPKRSAPDWKAEVEQKMEQMNRNNQDDKKFVKKAPDAERDKSETPQPGKSQSNINVRGKEDRKSVTQKHRMKSTRPAPGFGFPLVKRKVKSQMNEDEITSELAILDVQLKDLEKKGVKLEEALRDEMELAPEFKNESDQLLGEWFELVQQKNKLVRRETDLVYLMQQQRLEQEHVDVEFKIRKLMNKPESEKTEEDREEESKLLAQLVDIVERRNTIINSIEEARVKEEEEDDAYDKIKLVPGNATSGPHTSKKKKKIKVKKMFGKKKKSSKSSKMMSPPTSGHDDQ